MPLTENKAPDWTASEEREKVVRFLHRRTQELQVAKGILPPEYKTLHAQADAAISQVEQLAHFIERGGHNFD